MIIKIFQLSNESIDKSNGNQNNKKANIKQTNKQRIETIFPCWGQGSKKSTKERINCSFPLKNNNVEWDKIKNKQLIPSKNRDIINPKYKFWKHWGQKHWILEHCKTLGASLTFYIYEKQGTYYY